MHTEAQANPAPDDELRTLEARFEVLLSRCRRGERDGFDELMALSEPRVRRLLGRLVGRRADLDDLVQETYLRVWRSLGRFRGESRFSTWLFSIATNVALSWRRGFRTLAPLPEEAGLALAPGPGLSEGPLMAAYERALSRLSPELKAAFVLHESEGLAYRDVAEVLGCPVGTVMSRLHRARAKILEELRDRLEELSP